MGNRNSTLKGYSFGFREGEMSDGKEACFGILGPSGRKEADFP